jgi:hypothetical protein
VVDVWKRCPRCKTQKPKTDFNKNASRHDGLQRECRACQQERGREYYHRSQKRREDTRKAHSKRRKRNARFVLEYLSSHPCIDCGEPDPVVLDFDHVRGKKKNSVSNLVRGGYSIASIQSEIEKCEVRCANCHRRKTRVSSLAAKGPDCRSGVSASEVRVLPHPHDHVL